MSKLIKLSGLIPENNNNDVISIMIDNARLFMMAGGILTLADWMELNDSEKIAFIKARESFTVDINNTGILSKFVDKLYHKLKPKQDE